MFIASLYAIKFRQKDRRLYRLFSIFAFVLFIEFIFIGATIQVSIPRRASFQYSILDFILIAVVMVYCFDYFKHCFKIGLVAFICCLIINLSIVSFVSFECYHMRIKWDLMLESIKEQKNNGIKDVIVDEHTFKSKYWGYGDWENPEKDSDDWVNKLYADFYGVDTFNI